MRTTDDGRPSTVPTRGVSRDGPEREETGYVGGRGRDRVRRGRVG